MNTWDWFRAATIQAARVARVTSADSREELTCTMLTQSIYQTINGTPSRQRQYDELKERRGSGRAKIVMIRRLCGVMRRMLLEVEQFHWLKEELYQRKLRQYRAGLENDRREQNAT